MQHPHWMVAALVMAAPVSVVAQPVRVVEPQAVSMRSVAYADLDLSTNAGRAALDRRIGAAARRLCAADPAFGGRLADAEARCEAATAAGARGQVMAAAARQGGLAVRD